MICNCTIYRIKCRGENLLHPLGTGKRWTKVHRFELLLAEYDNAKRMNDKKQEQRVVDMMKELIG